MSCDIFFMSNPVDTSPMQNSVSEFSFSHGKKIPLEFKKILLIPGMQAPLGQKNLNSSKDFRSQYCSYIKSYWARRLFLYTEIIEKNPKAFSYQGSIDYPEFMSHMINE